MKRISWMPGFALAALFLALAGFPTPVAHAVVDATPPTGTIVINSNRSATNTPNVTLALTWDDGIGGSGVSRMRFSNDGSTWSAWEVLAAARPYVLPGGDGYKTVRIQYLDKANNRSAVFSDYIRLDATPPTGGIIINDGDATTAIQSVTLGLTWADGAGAGVSRMRFSDNGSTWTAWEAATVTRGHTLPAGLGYHTVRAQYIDGAGNYSAVCNDYIKLVNPAPGTTETVMLPGEVPLEMVWMPGGTFTMGSPNTELDRVASEGPQHSVTLNGYWMGKYELTKRQWQAVMVTAPWSGQTNVLADLDSPAVYVSWNDARSFIIQLNGYTGKTFRLPSEAQWEYACRAGTTSRLYWGEDPSYSSVGFNAWYNLNTSTETYAHLVGQKLPNDWGLYDMSGNAWEWCEDDWHDNYAGAPTGGQTWVDTPRGAGVVVRSGSWSGNRGYCRSAYRSHFSPSYTYNPFGFRLARS